jgi:HEAT repeat protein
MKWLVGMVVLAALVSGCGQPLPTQAGGKPVSYWVQALQNPDPKVRRTAVFKLGNVGPADGAALPAVQGALRDRDPRVRREAILALVKFGADARQALPLLNELRHDCEGKVRADAVRAMEKLAADAESSL